MESGNNNNGAMESKIWGVVTGRGRIILEVFLMGTGLMAWIFAMFLSPIADVRKDISLIQKDIQVIQTNHEAHIQACLEQMSELKQEIVDLNKQVIVQNESIIRLLTMHNLSATK
jgi:hypothetical protein